MAGIYGDDIECSGYIMCICLQPDKVRTMRLVAWLGAVKEQILIYGPRVSDHK
jgi:hypothetical protein